MPLFDQHLTIPDNKKRKDMIPQPNVLVIQNSNYQLLSLCEILAVGVSAGTHNKIPTNKLTPFQGVSLNRLRIGRPGVLICTAHILKMVSKAGQRVGKLQYYYTIGYIQYLRELL